jgi:hypothetical protein
MERRGWGRGFVQVAALGAALSTLLTAGCGDDSGGDGKGAGSGSGGASVAGAAPSAGSATAGSDSAGTGTAGSNTGGTSGNTDLAALCMTVCTKYNQTCAATFSCADACQMIAAGPSGCAGLQHDYLACLSSRSPICGNNSWGNGYEDVCDGKGRGVCLLTKGAECVAGESYDDTLCQAFGEGNFGYYCQANVVPKPGCKFSQSSTEESLYCCESKLSL